MSVSAPARPLSRPALRWHGGKWRLAPWIIDHMPEHRVYVEPYAGAASVLLRKPRAYSEVYNDLDGEVVGLFRILRDPVQAARLAELLELTPYARSEFEAAYAACTCPVETARRLVVRSFQGFGADGHNADVATGFRSSATRNGTTPAHDWRNYPGELA
ncbi:MAG: DNA adenine methylase, partial [Alphaproteobacteria bacterium]|nr:DNA adenine methylase [Alphaproteobacteria bacterium]